MASGKSCAQGRPKSKLRDVAVIAQILKLRKTMTWEEVSQRMGVSTRTLQKVICEEWEGPAETYRPKLLRPWPSTMDFSIDDLSVRA